MIQEGTFACQKESTVSSFLNLGRICATLFQSHGMQLIEAFLSFEHSE